MGSVAVNGFGDADPEDAWDPDDPLAELADNLARRAAILEALPADHPRLALRLRLLADDLAHLATRIREEI